MTTVPRDDARFEREALCWLPEVSRYAQSLTRDDSQAEDLVQDIFFIAFENWSQYVPGSECRAWLFTICRNHFYRLRGRADRQVAADAPELEALAAAAIHASARSSGIDDVFERTEVIEAIEGAIAELPEPYRDAAILVDLHDHTYDSASSILGVPVGTVRSRLFRARRILQEKLIAHARDAGIVPSGATENDRGSPR